MQSQASPNSVASEATNSSSSRAKHKSRPNGQSREIANSDDDIKQIKNILGNMTEKKILKLVTSSKQLRNILKQKDREEIYKEMKEKCIDEFISSIGDDESAWERLKAKHKGTSESEAQRGT